MNMLVMGVGGAGCLLAREVREVTGIRAIGLNTDTKALHQHALDRHILIGKQTSQGRGGISTALGKRTALESRPLWEPELQGIQTLVLMAGLGGGTGTGASVAIAEVACKHGINVLCAMTLPFHFEVQNRKNALEGRQALQEMGSKLVVQCLAQVMDDPQYQALGVEQMLAKARHTLITAVLNQTMASA
jgi:cell division protein FtsZ